MLGRGSFFIPLRCPFWLLSLAPQVKDFAVLIKELTKSNSTIKVRAGPSPHAPPLCPSLTHARTPHLSLHLPLPLQMLPATKDDPKQRRPDITTAKTQLGWEPRVPVREGLAKAIAYFSKELAASGEIVPTGPDASKPQKKHHVDTASLSTGPMVAAAAKELGREDNIAPAKKDDKPTEPPKSA